jgi:hypothetical protein
MGKPSDDGSFAFTFGFGGYHLVTDVKHELGVGGFNTTVTAKFVLRGGSDPSEDNAGTRNKKKDDPSCDDITRQLADYLSDRKSELVEIDEELTNETEEERIAREAALLSTSGDMGSLEDRQDRLIRNSLGVEQAAVESAKQDEVTRNAMLIASAIIATYEQNSDISLVNAQLAAQPADIKPLVFALVARTEYFEAVEDEDGTVRSLTVKAAGGN